MKKLDRSTVAPTIDRPVRILQFGEGNFLRAFVDWMIDLANEKGLIDSSVAVVSPRFHNGRGIETLRRQQGLYHIVLEGIEDGRPKQETRLITCISEVLAPELPADMARYRQLIVSPELRFVISNTTEAGIRYEADDVTADAPATFPGKVCSLLHRRWQAFNGDPAKGLIFICCELIEDNGSTLREYVLRHARETALPDAFIDWVNKSNIFVDTLVDRIVPGFPHDTIDSLKETLGYDDNAVVKGELYHLWAIGGDNYQTVAAELPLDRAGLHVLFMPGIKEFRDKKVRILNGSHTGMVPVALQLGCETVMDAFNNPQVNRFVNDMVEHEVLPMIAGDPKELQAFADSILERFYNPYIKHYLRSIALNSLSKWEARNWPTVKDMWQKRHAYADRELFTLAALLSLYGPGSGFTPEDNAGHLEKINAAWDDNDYSATVARILGSGIFIADFEAEVPGLTQRVAARLADIRRNGMQQALSNC